MFIILAQTFICFMAVYGLMEILLRALRAWAHLKRQKGVLIHVVKYEEVTEEIEQVVRALIWRYMDNDEGACQIWVVGKRISQEAEYVLYHMAKRYPQVHYSDYNGLLQWFKNNEEIQSIYH